MCGFLHVVPNLSRGDQSIKSIYKKKESLATYLLLTAPYSTLTFFLFASMERGIIRPETGPLLHLRDGMDGWVEWGEVRGNRIRGLSGKKN